MPEMRCVNRQCLVVALALALPGCAGSDEAVSAARAAVTTAPGATLLSDDFDRDNVPGQPPTGWVVRQPEGTQVAISEAAVAPASPPYAVELRDDSPLLRPEIERALAEPTGAGSVSVRVRIDARSDAPLGVQLRDADGHFLGAALVSADGRAGYDVGGGTVASDVTWTPGVWSTLRLDWFPDHRFDAYLDAAKVADGVALGAPGMPARVVVTAGYGSAIGRKAYVDAVTSTALVDAERFAGGQLDGFGLSTPPGTAARVVDGALELVDDAPGARVEAVRAFTPTPEGSLTLETMVPTIGEAPFDLQLARADGAFLLALRLGDDGLLAYNASPAGAGPFTRSQTAWAAGRWHHLRVDWTGQDRFSCFLDGAEVVHDVPFAIAGDPAKLRLVAGTAATTGRKAYVGALAVVRTPIESVRGRYDENALWLSHCYTSGSPCVALVPDLLRALDTDYGVHTIFVNIGRVDASGALERPESGLGHLDELLAAVRAYEAEHGVRFHVVAWLNGDLKDGTATVTDLGNPAVRSAIVGETARFVSPLAPGAYVKPDRRLFDGVQLDLEPSGFDPVRFASFEALLRETRAAWDALGVSGDLGVAAHAPGTSNEWQWSPSFFYEVAPLVDHIAVMTYDSGVSSAEEYRAWIAMRTQEALRAISGESFDDALHPPPARPPRVFIGLPAFPASAYHHREAETVRWGALGLDAAMSTLLEHGSLGATYLRGAAIYVHTDGADDRYATWGRDWWWLGRYWLGRW